MPSNRSLRTRGLRKIPTSETAWAILTDSPLPDDHNPWEALFLGDDADLHPLWEKHRKRILNDWISKHPCSRPSCFWKFDAPRWHNPEHEGCFYHGKLPQPRLRISGKGELHHGMPFFERAIPLHWDAETLNPEEPLIFESEAAYLLRHDLLTDTEKKWLKTNKKALKPEIIEV